MPCEPCSPPRSLSPAHLTTHATPSPPPPIPLQLEVRVRSTVAQRDDTISALKEKLDEAELRRRHAETLLARQRQELLAASS